MYKDVYKLSYCTLYTVHFMRKLPYLKGFSTG